MDIRQAKYGVINHNQAQSRVPLLGQINGLGRWGYAASSIYAGSTRRCLSIYCILLNSLNLTGNWSAQPKEIHVKKLG